MFECKAQCFFPFPFFFFPPPTLKVGPPMFNPSISGIVDSDSWNEKEN